MTKNLVIWMLALVCIALLYYGITQRTLVGEQTMIAKQEAAMAREQMILAEKSQKMAAEQQIIAVAAHQEAMKQKEVAEQELAQCRKGKK